MRYLAIDFGAKRVGLALSDEGGQFATPLQVLERAGVEAAITKICRQEGVDQLVVGLPLNMDDSMGPTAQAIVRWAQQLANAIPIKVNFADERLSSFIAEERLATRRKAGERLTRGKKKSRQDAHAAASFLQDFLDQRKS